MKPEDSLRIGAYAPTQQLQRHRFCFGTYFLSANLLDQLILLSTAVQSSAVDEQIGIRVKSLLLRAKVKWQTF